jgi:hypothetical protein
MASANAKAGWRSTELTSEQSSEERVKSPAPHIFDVRRYKAVSPESDVAT